jgi:hypothetical protein
MPTVLRVGRYSFYFFSNEGLEPPYIHAKAGGDEAKFWLDPVSLAANYGFRGHELRDIERIVREHRAFFLEAWYERRDDS